MNCKLAKKNYGVDMFNGMWSEFLASNPKETYDLIFTSHVLEHIVNPMQFIRECASICNRYMFVEVPCFDIKPFSDEPFGMFTDEHVNFFTIQSLWSLMQNAGFSPIEFEMIFDLTNYTPSGTPAIVSLWQKNGKSRVIYDSADCLERYLAEHENLIQEIDAKIKMIPPNEKLAVWGIGNNLFKLLANTSLAEKNIVRVYDSDAKKRGIKVNGLPIQPFNLEDVLSGEVESILITTYTAQKAILRAIDKMNLPCKVYKLYDI